MGKITALSAKVLSKPGRHGDGEGLYLNIAPSGSKSWVQRIVVDGRRRDIGLRPYPAVGLASARAIATTTVLPLPKAGTRLPRSESQPRGVQELIQIAKDRSPVYDIVTHPVNVTIELKK